MSVVDTASNTLTSTISGLSLAQNVSARPLPPGIVVPDVVGDTQSTATNAIVAAGLALGSVTHQTSSAVAPGSVISQLPAGGELAGANAAVGLVLSSGVSVPNVVGTTQAAATSAITSAGLTVGTLSQQSDPTVAAGSVLSESPTAGTNVAGGSAVNLVVSTGAGGGSGSGYGGGGGGAMDWLTLAVMLGFLFVPMSAYRKPTGRGR
jgi:beta-lactam-binding protein with PASTA domain